MTCSSLRLLTLATLLGFVAAPLSIRAQPTLRCEIRDQTLRLTIAGAFEASEVEVRLASDRNQPVVRLSDVSPLAPPTKRTTPPAPREVFWPTVDLAPEPGLRGVLRVAGAPGEAWVNQHFFKTPLAGDTPELTIPAEQLLHWENAVCIQRPDLAAESFTLRLTVPLVHGRAERELALLSRQWSGRVSLHDATGRELAAQSVSTPAPKTADSTAITSLEQALVATARYLLASQDQQRGSPTFGGLHLFYDLDARTFRSSHWVWGWGPAVKFLLEADRLPAVANHFPPGRLREAAEQIGRASLRFIVTDPAHPARGVSVSRWNRNATFPTGYEQRISVADAQFLAGWAWMPLYRATGDAAFLQATVGLLDATERLLNEHPIIPQDYYEEPKRWAGHIVDESGFGMKGPAELFAVTGEARHRDVGLRNFEIIRARLERPDGVWERGWEFAGHIRPAGFVTRGMGWAMEGLLSAHQAAPEAGYLASAVRLADRVIGWQHADGSWSFNASRLVAEVGVGEKATALWSLLLYRLHALTGDPKHLAAARLALQWCRDNQYTGPDPEAFGGIPGVKPASAVGYRNWFRVSCTYTSGFFGLAALEELRRQSEK